MKKYDPIQMEMLLGFSIFLLIFSLFFAICILLGSCKSIKTDVQYQYRDSIITHHVIDTTHVQVYDTTHIEQSQETHKDDELEIQFGAGGGTYNTQTGEATNVNNVKQKSKEKELQNTITSQAHTIDYQAATIDSLRQALNEAQAEEHMQANTKEITPRSGWDKFCTWWTVGSWILLILLAAWWAFKKFYLHR